MARLGEALVEAGQITKDQLAKALERQIIFGGRIGTNLVELGFLSEEALTKYLAQYHRIPYADASCLDQIDAETLAAITPEIAKRYIIIPFKKDRRRIHLATVDPLDFKVIDELRFITECEISPYIVSELRVLLAMEKYYQIDRSLRYVSVLRRQSATPSSEPEITGGESPQAAAAYRDAVMALTDVGLRDDIPRSVYPYLALQFQRACFFIVKGNTLQGWWGPKEEDRQALATLQLPLTAPSVFHQAIETKTFYRGPLIAVPPHQPLLEHLKTPPPEVYILPIPVRNKIVSVFYGDGGASPLPPDLEGAQRILAKAALAFEILLLRTKILET